MAPSPASTVPVSQFPPLASAMTTEAAVFALAHPIKVTIDDKEVELAGFDMRALAMSDCPLLDQFNGQPIALAQNLIAALCYLSLDEVRQLNLDDLPCSPVR